jgi:2-polyprenyl-3-methyl-5-hydroxy-6-metoxy-1,4-benzoquinol methylase
MSVIGKYLRPPARRVAAPVFRALDLRLARHAERLEAHTVNLARHHESINEQIVSSYNEALNTSRALVRTEGEAVGEYVLAMARIEERIVRAIEGLKVDAMPRTLDAVDWPAADYLSWVSSADGLLAMGDLFVNHAIDLRVEPGLARLAGVNERIVELPLAHAVCAGMPGSRVLDVGSCESILALELASLGHEVVALDPRRYPFSHTGLTTVQATVDAWRGPEVPFDIITCISAIEHFGIGSYGLAQEVEADHRAMARFSEWLKPDGRLVLSVPYGRSNRTELQRVYDDASLGALTAPFVEESRRVFRRIDATQWVPVDPSDPPVWTDDAPGVAVVLLRHR